MEDYCSYDPTSNVIFSCFIFRSKLQVILLMECLRLHDETEIDLKLPKLAMSKKKKDLSLVFKSMILDYIDKMCIWSAVNSHGSLYKDYIEPILMN
jgi:hypothetical protein